MKREGRRGEEQKARFHSPLLERGEVLGAGLSSIFEGNVLDGLCPFLLGRIHSEHLSKDTKHSADLVTFTFLCNLEPAELDHLLELRPKSVFEGFHNYSANCWPRRMRNNLQLHNAANCRHLPYLIQTCFSWHTARRSWYHSQASTRPVPATPQGVFGRRNTAHSISLCVVSAS